MMTVACAAILPSNPRVDTMSDISTQAFINILESNEKYLDADDEAPPGMGEIVLPPGMGLAGDDDDSAGDDDDVSGDDDDAACAGILSVAPEQDEADENVAHGVLALTAASRPGYLKLRRKSSTTWTTLVGSFWGV